MMISTRSPRDARPHRMAALALACCFALLGLPLSAQSAQPLPSGSGARALGQPVAALNSLPSQAVGHVSLLIGQVWLARNGAEPEPLRRGMAVQVGDRIETSPSGHVHLRFVDDAAVAVRPDSTLQILAYRYDPDRPSANEVRLQVDQGVTRSISGRATEHDRTRFRLNTPVAAIGIRGTDFIVHTSGDSMRALVAEGAIVVSALGEGCSAAGVGPCAGPGSRLLSADMRHLMLEVQRGDDAARLVPAGALQTAVGVDGTENRLMALRTAAAAARHAGLLGAEPYGRNDQSAADLLVIAADALPDLNRRPNLDAQLTWGRYALSPGVNDELSLPFAIARLRRHETVGTDEFTLFRANDPANPERLLRPDSGQVDFRLSRAQATYEVGNQIDAAQVDGGTLSLDFSRRTFATALALSAPGVGEAELRMAGDVRADGTFSVRDDGTRQAVAGAVSLDGREAGYLFERGLGDGLFRGKTLWGR